MQPIERGTRRRRVAAMAVGAVAAAMVVPALLNPVSAAPESAAVPTPADGTSAPYSGTLPNSVSYELDKGSFSASAAEGWNMTVPEGPYTWTFDRPVDLRFGIRNIQVTDEGVILPAGTQPETIHEHHIWDGSSSLVRQGPGTVVADESTFTLENTTSLVLVPTGASGWSRALSFIEVTYNLPVASINGPADGGSYELGGGQQLDFTCADGTGTVTGTATIDGHPIAAGDPVDGLGAGTHSIEVTCTDEHGGIHTSTVTFEVVDNTDPAVAVDGPADGATYEVGDDVVADFSCQDVDLVECTAVDGDGNPVHPGDPIDTTTPGTYTITVTGTDGAGNVTTRTVTYTVVPACEHGLALLNEPGLDADRTHVLVSGGVHKGTEDTTRAVIDPITVPLLGLNTTELVHQVNCEIVDPVEDLVDSITVPLIQDLGLQGALRGLFG